MKYTITRALTELKVLRGRYFSELSAMKLIAVKHGKKLRSPYSSYKEEDFKNQSQATYQSVVDIEKRIVAIKSAIEKSNFVTMVKIGDKEMTVLDALNMKNLIDLKEHCLTHYKSQMRDARMEYERALQDNKMRVEKMVSEQIASGSGKDSELEKTTSEAIESMYEVSFVDILNLDEKIQQLEKEISDFKNNVDYALSESNSMTYIEVED